MIVLLLLLGGMLFAQTPSCPPGYIQVPLASSGVLVCSPSTGPVSDPNTVAIALPSTPITYTPDIVVSSGGGFASPNGKFAYYSISKYIGQSSYATMANQYTIVKGKVMTCALAGLTKEMYQFGYVVLGLTGLGGGCEGFDGNAQAAGNAQAFAHIHFGKTSWGLLFTFMKPTSPGYQITIAPAWSK